MKNLKIRVNNEAESKEAQELFFKLGGKWKDSGRVILNYDHGMPFFYLDGSVLHKGSSIDNYNFRGREEITLPELRAMANPMKEWINTKTYEYKQAAFMSGHSDWIAIPEGAIRARFYQYDPDALEFENSACQWWGDETKGWIDYMDYSKAIRDSRVVWQRATHPEELPFIDDEPKSLNDQYAEIEQVRQESKDNVNHPGHYTSDPSGIECIEVTRHRNFNIGNAMKYLWRNGLKDSDAQIQDLKKAIWYIEDEIKRLEK